MALLDDCLRAIIVTGGKLRTLHLSCEAEHDANEDLDSVSVRPKSFLASSSTSADVTAVNLSHISLSGLSLSRGDFAALAGIPYLEKLSIVECVLVEEEDGDDTNMQLWYIPFRAPGAFPSLTDLYFAASHIPPPLDAAYWMSIGAVKALQHLRISERKLGSVVLTNNNDDEDEETTRSKDDSAEHDKLDTAQQQQQQQQQQACVLLLPNIISIDIEHCKDPSHKSTQQFFSRVSGSLIWAIISFPIARLAPQHCNLVSLNITVPLRKLPDLTPAADSLEIFSLGGLNAPVLTADDFAMLAKMRKMRDLEFRYSPSVDGLGQLGEGCGSLERLSLIRSRLLGDRCITGLERLPRLKQLSLENCSNISGEDLLCLVKAASSSLTALDLRNIDKPLSGESARNTAHGIGSLGFEAADE